MGGNGSGQRDHRRMTTGEVYFALPIHAVRKLLELGKGCEGTFNFQGDSREFRLTVDPPTLSLAANHSPEGSGQSATDWIPLEAAPQPFGGVRWWFTCPWCRRRCRFVYLPRPELPFRCRRCYGLRYASQCEDPAARFQRRAAHWYRRARGVSAEPWDLESFPPRPRGMHWRTYHRLEGAWNAALEAWATCAAREVGRLFGHLTG